MNDDHNPEANKEAFKQLILTYLASKQKSKATEKMAQEFIKQNHIYTIRSDEKDELWIYKDGVYVPEGKTYVKEYVRKILDEAYTPHLSNEVIQKIETDTYVEANSFFTNCNIERVVVENGVLNVLTEELTQFDPETIYFNKLPVKYDPEAKCEAWIKHLTEVLKYKEDINIMQEIFGYCLYKEYKFEKAFMFSGSGRNGKGKTLSVLKHLVGVDNCCSVSIIQMETNNFSTSGLLNKMVNLAGDIESTALKQTNKFKQLTGRDLFTCNELPKTYDNSNGFWMRWELLEFPYSFVPKKEYDKLQPEDKEFVKIQDPEILEKLTTPEELSGILNWSLKGLKRLWENKAFTNSKNATEIKKVWIRKADSFKAFLMDHCKIDYYSYVVKSDLRKMYGVYCRKNQLKGEGDKYIKQVLSEQGVGEERKMVEGSQVPCWVGIKCEITPPQSSDSKGNKDINGFSYLLETKSLYKSKKTIDMYATLDIRNQILDVLEKNDIFEIHKLINNSTENPNVVESAIEELKKQGSVFEPRPGFIKKND